MSPPSPPGARQLSPFTAYIMLIAVQLAWASNLVVARGVFETVPPVGLSFWRWLAAALIMIPLVWRTLPHEIPIIRQEWKTIALLAFFMVGGSTLAVTSVTFTTATNASLVNATQPAITAFFAWLIVKDRLSWLQSLGIVSAAFGIGAMVTRFNIGVLLNLDINSGDFVMLSAVVGYALYATYFHRAPKGLTPATLLFVIFLAGSIELIPFYVAETVTYMPVPATWHAAWVTFYLATLPSVGAIFMWNAGLRTVGVTKAAIFVNLLPVFGAGLAILFLGERLYFYHVLGAAFVCAGILLVVKGKRQLAPQPAVSADSA